MSQESVFNYIKVRTEINKIGFGLEGEVGFYENNEIIWTHTENILTDLNINIQTLYRNLNSLQKDSDMNYKVVVVRRKSNDMKYKIRIWWVR